MEEESSDEDGAECSSENGQRSNNQESKSDEVEQQSNNQECRSDESDQQSDNQECSNDGVEQQSDNHKCRSDERASTANSSDKDDASHKAVQMKLIKRKNAPSGSKKDVKRRKTTLSAHEIDPVKYPDPSKGRVEFGKHITKTPENHIICLVCSKTFSTKQNAETHVKGIHFGITYKCDRCGRNTFTAKANLSNHLKKCRRQ